MEFHNLLAAAYRVRGWDDQGIIRIGRDLFNGRSSRAGEEKTQQVDFSQLRSAEAAAAGVLLIVATAAAPPITARAKATAITGFFIKALPFRLHGICGCSTYCAPRFFSVSCLTQRYAKPECLTCIFLEVFCELAHTKKAGNSAN